MGCIGFIMDALAQGPQQLSYSIFYTTPTMANPMMNLTPSAQDIVLLRELYLRLRSKLGDLSGTVVDGDTVTSLISRVQYLYTSLLRAAIVPRADRLQPINGSIIPPDLELEPSAHNDTARQLLAEIRDLLRDEARNLSPSLLGHRVEFEAEIETVDTAHRCLVRGDLTGYSQTHMQMVFELQQFDLIPWHPTKSDVILLRKMTHFLERKKATPEVTSKWLYDSYSQALKCRLSAATPPSIQSLVQHDNNILQAEAVDNLKAQVKLLGLNGASGPPQIVHPLRSLQENPNYWTGLRKSQQEATSLSTRFMELYADPTYVAAGGTAPMDRLYMTALEAIQVNCGMTEDMLLSSVDNIEAVKNLLISMNLAREHWGPILERWGKRKAQVETMLKKGLQPCYFSMHAPALATPSSNATTSSQANAGSSSARSASVASATRDGDAPIPLVRELHGRERFRL